MLPNESASWRPDKVVVEVQLMLNDPKRHRMIPNENASWRPDKVVVEVQLMWNDPKRHQMLPNESCVVKGKAVIRTLPNDISGRLGRECWTVIVLCKVQRLFKPSMLNFHYVKQWSYFIPECSSSRNRPRFNFWVRIICEEGNTGEDLSYDIVRSLTRGYNRSPSVCMGVSIRLGRVCKTFTRKVCKTFAMRLDGS